MKALLIVILTIHSTVIFANLDREFYNSDFIVNKTEGNLSREELETIKESLYQLNHHELWDMLIEKLRIKSIDDLGVFIKSCKTKTDTLGYYQRGEKTRQMFSVDEKSDFLKLDHFWKDNIDLLEQVNKSYSHYVENNGFYISLIIQSWPVICIRPNRKFYKIIETFVHEAIHFLNDDNKTYNLTEFDSEDDYCHHRLYSSGGEVDAHIAEAKVSQKINLIYDFKSNADLLSFFEEDLVKDTRGLEDYLLTTLNYKYRFINNYRTNYTNDLNRKITNLNYEIDVLNLYYKNLNISKSNLETTKHNISIYENNINVYEQLDDKEKRDLAKKKRDLAKQEINQLKSSVLFYQNMITIAEIKVEEYKLKLDQLTSKTYP